MSQETRRKEQPSLGRTLDLLASGSVQPDDLTGLSDLNRAEAAEFAARWPLLPESTRVRAVRLMTELEEDQVNLSFSRVLRIALGDPSPAVRQLAIEALWEDESTSFCETLLSMMRDDDSLDVRAAAAQGLAPFAEKATSGDLDDQLGATLRSALLGAADEPGVPYLVRRRALESVATFGGAPDIEGAILAAFEADDPGLKVGAVYAMGQSLDRRWLDLLAVELESEDAELRYEAAVAAGKIGDDQLLSPLLVCADDEDVEVRHAAIQAIGQLGSRSAVSALRRLAADPREPDAEAIDAALDEALVDTLP